MLSRLFSARRRFLASLSWWSYPLVLNLERFILSVIIGTIWTCFTPMPGPGAGAVYAPPLLYLVKVLLGGPIAETLVFQCLVIETTRRLKCPPGWQLLASIIPFAFVHFLEGGLEHGVFAGILGGYYLAFTYLLYRERSLAWALGMTLGLHIFHNILANIVLYLEYPPH